MSQGGRPGGGLFLFYPRGHCALGIVDLLRRAGAPRSGLQGKARNPVKAAHRLIRLLGQLLGVSNIEQLSVGK
jgi:hypothetical protein